MRTRFTPRHLLALGLLVFIASHWLPRLFPALLTNDPAKGLLAGIGIGLEVVALCWATRFRHLRGKGPACPSQPV